MTDGHSVDFNIDFRIMYCLFMFDVLFELESSQVLFCAWLFPGLLESSIIVRGT